jgi:hypothetical protein
LSPRNLCTCSEAVCYVHVYSIHSKAFGSNTEEHEELVSGSHCLVHDSCQLVGEEVITCFFSRLGFFDGMQGAELLLPLSRRFDHGSELLLPPSATSTSQWNTWTCKSWVSERSRKQARHALQDPLHSCTIGQLLSLRKHGTAYNINIQFTETFKVQHISIT